MTEFPTSTIPPYGGQQPPAPMPRKDRPLPSLFICAVAGFISYHLLPRKVNKIGSSVVVISTWMLRHSIQNFLERCLKSLSSQSSPSHFSIHYSDCKRPPIILLNNSHQTTPSQQPSNSQGADRGRRQGRREGQTRCSAEGSPPPSQSNVGDRGTRQGKRPDQTGLSAERSSSPPPFSAQTPTENTFSHGACSDTRQEKRLDQTGLSAERSSSPPPFSAQTPTENTFSHGACSGTRQGRRPDQGTSESSSNGEGPMNPGPARQEKRR